MTIGNRIKNRRKELAMTAEELADIIGKSRATVYRYENGDIENMPTNVLEPLATALYTTPAYLMGWTDDAHDWEQIGNDNGISPPKDYTGSYEEYVKYKVMEESDESIDEYYDSYYAAIDCIKESGGDVIEIDGSDDITVKTNSGRQISTQANDLVHGFLLFRDMLINEKSVRLTKDEEELLEFYNKLNTIGKDKAFEYVVDLADNSKYLKGKPHLITKAAHERTDIEVTEDMKQHDDDIMNDDSEWE